MIKIYQVGGSVRDMILGVKSKDIDYAVEAPSYEAMREYVISIGGDIKVETPEFVTIRAVINHAGYDFVLCRKDGYYSDGRRPDVVIPGTLYDDLARRDFTMNAIAIDENGDYIDYFGGLQHIDERVIYCVGSPYERFNEDTLRMVRALRFAITKKMELHFSVEQELFNSKLIRKLTETVSIERVYDELMKMFKADTKRTMYFYQKYYALMPAVLEMGQLWLKPTLEER